MCGIVCAINNQANASVAAKTIYRYTAQRTRGVEGFGLCAWNSSNKLTNYVRKVDEIGILSELVKAKGSESILFHHRLPTSTANRENACHPFRVAIGDKVFYLVHNGIIYNADERHQELSKTHGFASYDTITRDFNDSECLAIDVAEYLSGRVDKIKSSGAIAFIVLECDVADNALRLHYARNSSSPLTVDNINKIKVKIGRAHV
ncbi:MAG: hypothetical protein HKUEN01_03000 [Candidatus Kuenenia stuttgartiensis]|nr:MAG: hypothetical protein HKUEN01_03000 [Candidatus Kuenenia stuttgartiensis]